MVQLVSLPVHYYQTAGTVSLKPMKNPSRAVTVRDIAAEVGVSKTTAAAILRAAPGFSASAETRQRVLEASIQLGYRRNAVASSLSLGRTHAIGLLLPFEALDSNDESVPDLRRSYSQDLFLAVFKAATRAGLRVLAISSPRQGSSATVDSVTDERRVDGVVLSAKEPTLIPVLEQAGVAWVGISSATGPYHVHPDNAGGAEAAVAHLVELGHRRITHWRGGYGTFAMDARAQGFRSAAARYGLTTPSVITEPEEIIGLLALPVGQRPTAFFVHNDYAAIVLMDLARNAGLRVPEDISVVGFDNGLLAAATRPALTTIHNPLDGQASGAINVLQALWRGEEPTAQQTIPTRLVIRNTTAPPPVY